MNGKKCAVFFIFYIAIAFSFAYNPPFGGEDMMRLTSPHLLSGAASASAGPLAVVAPESACYNPALAAGEERAVLSASASMLYNSYSSDEGDRLGGGFEAGLIVPGKWLSYSASVQGLFFDNTRLFSGSAIIAHAGIAKDVFENLFVGGNIYSGVYFGNGSGFTVGADFGALYLLGDFSFLKDVRLGASLLNVGKPLSESYEAVGFDGKKASGYPSILTPRASASALFLDSANVKMGLSLDIASPFFQNVIVEEAFGIQWKNLLSLTCSWQANIRELSEKTRLNLPSLGVSVKIPLFTKSERVKENLRGSDIVTALAWQQLYGGVQDIAAGALFYLGKEDTEAPIIMLWDDGDENYDE